MELLLFRQSGPTSVPPAVSREGWGSILESHCRAVCAVLVWIDKCGHMPRFCRAKKGQAAAHARGKRNTLLCEENQSDGLMTMLFLVSLPIDGLFWSIVLHSYDAFFHD